MLLREEYYVENICHSDGSKKLFCRRTLGHVDGLQQLYRKGSTLNKNKAMVYRYTVYKTLTISYPVIYDSRLSTD